MQSLQGRSLIATFRSIYKRFNTKIDIKSDCEMADIVSD